MLDNNMKVGIFIPCCVDQFAADTGMRMVKLLQSIGVECFYPSEMTCCGKELYTQGDREGAKALGEKMMELYDGCTHVVSCSSGCVTYVKNHFAHLFHNTTFHNTYRQFADKIYDISDFLVNIVHYTPRGVSFPHKVVFMDHCNTMRQYHCTAHPERKGLTVEPRQLLRSVEGLQLAEMKQQDVCCGLGGSFANQFTAISDSLAKRKVDNAIATGVKDIVATEMSCLLHLQSYIDKAGLPIACKHLVDILVAE